jgi:hypothetical protein
LKDWSTRAASLATTVRMVSDHSWIDLSVLAFDGDSKRNLRNEEVKVSNELRREGYR